MLTHTHKHTQSEHTEYLICATVSDFWLFAREVNYKIGLIIVCSYQVGVRKSMHTGTNMDTHTLRHTHKPLGEKSRQPWCRNVGRESSMAASIMQCERASLYGCVCVCVHG